MNDGLKRTKTELKPCPFCGSKYTQVRYMGGKWQEPSAFSSGYRGECCGCYAVTAAYDTEAEAMAAWNARAVSGDTSDGYHTFDELYYHRTALFACLVASQPRQMAFKAWKHADGTMYDGMFIAGIYTSRGWCTYHCESKWWPLFDCSEREFAPEWDGHTPSDAIHRLMGDFLPKQEVCGEVGE